MDGKSIYSKSESIAMTSNPLLSIVIPLFNEVDSLPHLKKAIDTVLEREKIDTEILFVNDGSTDGSDKTIDRFASEDSRVKITHFRRNRGKAAALDTAFRLAKGKYVITMDADLQDEPEEIPKFIEKLEEGYDLVSGWKKKRHDPLSKTIPSKLYNTVARIISGVKLHDFNCGFKIYRREVLDTIQIYGELHRFIPILVDAQGWRVGELEVKHNPRRWGKTKYGISRFLKGFLDMLSVTYITRFQSSPMYLFGTIGFIVLLAGSIVLAYLSVGWFMGVSISGRPLFFLGILMIIVGLQFFSLGLLGEMISHMRNAIRPRDDEDV